MKETPQRLRSFAPPTRDRIFIWCAVIAGCGIMALLGRHAAITRFGTDEFTGNVLFTVFLVLTIGLYFGFQSIIEEVFNRLQSLFRRHEVMAIAETPIGDQIAISAPEEPSVMPMKFSESISDEVGIEEDEVEFAEEIDIDSSFEVLEIIEGMRHIRFSDGTEAYVGMDLSDAVFAPSLVILTDSDSLYNLPDNVMMLVTVTSTKDEDWFIEELGKFILFLKELGPIHRIQHFAIAFSKDKPDHPATVQTADVTCIRLY